MHIKIGIDFFVKMWYYEFRLHSIVRSRSMKIKSVLLSTGFVYAILANLFFSFMTVSVFEVKVLDPSVSPFVVSFVRVIVNLLIILVPSMIKGEGRILFGDKTWSLWLRGFFGGGSLMLFFFSIQAIGPSESTFIQSVNGMFIVLLCPLVLGERFSLKAFTVVLVSLVGLYILFDPSLSHEKTFGQIIALVGGVFAAFSALMVAKAGKTNSPITIIFYFCFVAFLMHLVCFAVIGEVTFPRSWSVWGVMIAAGVFSTVAQFCMAKAYQIAPASLVAAIGYLGPVLNTVWGILLFQQMLTGRASIGCAIILVCGVFIPFLKIKNSAPKVDIKAHI